MGIAINAVMLVIIVPALLVIKLVFTKEELL